MQLDIQQILNGLRKRWWLALLVMLSAATVAYLVSKAQTPIYQSQATVVARPVPLDNGQIEAIKKTLPTYAQELANPDFWRQVIDSEQIPDVDVSALPAQIKVQPKPDENSITMTVDNPRARTAALLADRISNAFIERQAAEDQQGTPGGTRTVWTISQAAQEPSQPYQPRPLLNAGAAALFGLIVGLLLAIGLELLDTTVKSPGDIRQYLELNTMGIIPRGKV